MYRKKKNRYSDIYGSSNSGAIEYLDMENLYLPYFLTSMIKT